jgi:hypothetical protein
MFFAKFVALEKRTDGKFLNAVDQKYSVGAPLVLIPGKVGELTFP